MFSVTIQIFLTGSQEPVSVRYSLDAAPEPQLWRTLAEGMRVAIGTFSGFWDPREVIRASVEDFLVRFPELCRESHGVLVQVQAAPLTPGVA